MAEIKE
jgi:uncharacterized membrane protein (UPF0127 family)